MRSNQIVKTQMLRLTSDEKLKKLATQRHGHKDTFGEEGDFMSNSLGSPQTLTKERNRDNGDVHDVEIVSGSDEEVIEHDPMYHDQSGQLDQDFEFIDEVLAAFATDMQEKESVHTIVGQTIAQGKHKIPEAMLDTTMSEVKNLEDNFSKVIGFASK
jgi:hypothetical protein